MISITLFLFFIETKNIVLGLPYEYSSPINQSHCLQKQNRCLIIDHSVATSSCQPNNSIRPQEGTISILGTNRCANILCSFVFLSPPPLTNFALLHNATILGLVSEFTRTKKNNFKKSIIDQRIEETILSCRSLYVKKNEH